MSLFKILTRRIGSASPRRPRRWVSNDWTAYLMRVATREWHIVSKRGYGVTLWAVYVDGYTVPWWDNTSWYGDLLVKKRKPREVDGEQPAHLAPMESNVLSRCEALVAHCAATRYDDGDARQPGWWTVRTRGSAWELEIKDPDTCCRLVVIQATLDDALALAQALLTSDDAPWEPDPWLTSQKARQKKK